MSRSPVIILAALLLLLAVSCATTKEKEYVYLQPEPMDLEPSMQIVFDTRPDNSQLEIITDVKTVEDLLANSISYQMAWERWEDYSGRLESYLLKIKDELSKQ